MLDAIESFLRMVFCVILLVSGFGALFGFWTIVSDGFYGVALIALSIIISSTGGNRQ